MYKSSGSYRREAIDLLEGKYKNPILIILAYVLASGIYSWLQDALAGVHYETINGIFQPVVDRPTIYSLTNIVFMFLTGAVVYAIYYMTIRITKQAELDVQEVCLSGFKNDFWKNAFTSILVTIYTILWAFLFIIPGIVKSYAYSMSFYLRNKRPDMGSDEVITRSKELMNGHKMDLFLLDLSYIGWYFIGLFTLGILYLWIMPRHYTARTIMYNEIYAKEYGEEVETTVEESEDIFN